MSKVERFTYPVLQVRPWGLLVYKKTELHNYSKTHRQGQSRYFSSTDKKQEQGKQNQYTGHLTTYSRKRLKRAIQLIVATAQEKEATHFKSGKTFKFKVNFITLTLPSEQSPEITDKILKVCLDNWIKRAKRKYGLKSYVWRAERQGNGNLHFHVITDCYIRYDHLQNDWNSVLRPTGLIESFKKKHGHENPNSTDVHSISKIKCVAQYFSKYMAKDELTKEDLPRPPLKTRAFGRKIKETSKVFFKVLKTRKECAIEGKVWDCSSNLKTKDNCEMMLEGEQEVVWNRAFKDPQVNGSNENLFSLLFFDEKQFKFYVTGIMRNKWDEYCYMIRNKEPVRERIAV